MFIIVTLPVLRVRGRRVRVHLRDDRHDHRIRPHRSRLLGRPKPIAPRRQQAEKLCRELLPERQVYRRRGRSTAFRWCQGVGDQRQVGIDVHLLPIRFGSIDQGELWECRGLCLPLEQRLEWGVGAAGGGGFGLSRPLVFVMV